MEWQTNGIDLQVTGALLFDEYRIMHIVMEVYGVHW